MAKCRVYTYVPVNKDLLKTMSLADRALFTSLLAGVKIRTMADACGMTEQGMRDWVHRVMEQLRSFGDPLE